MAAPQQRDPGTDRLYVASVDPRLARLCKARPSLPEHVILAVLALADSCRAVKADCLQPPSRDSAGSNRSERTGGRKLAIYGLGLPMARCSARPTSGPPP